MDDDSFKINTPAIINTRKLAENLMNWCLTIANLCSLESFNKNITEHLQQVILSSATKSFMYNKEKLWRQFYLLRCLPDFILQWTAFLSECQIPVKPVLYQHLTDIIFKTLLQNHFRILQLETDNSMDSTNNERSALRYASGYICRHLRKKFERENHDLKEEMILCLASLVKDSNSEECGTDEEWLELMDRGGLYHVKETTFQLFCAIKGQVRSLLEALTKPCSSSKLEMIRKVIEDVQFIGLFLLLILRLMIRRHMTYCCIKLWNSLLPCVGFQKPVHGWKNINSPLRRPHNAPKVFVGIFTITLNT